MHGSTTQYGTPDENELAALAALLSNALLIPASGTQWMLQTLGPPNLRIVRAGGSVAAGLGIMDIGQWWGGRRVSTAGIVSVGVAPEQRGVGVGAALLRGMLAEQRERGTALSVLYASTQAFYRSSGYERAGTSMIYELPMSALPTARRELSIRRLEPGERELPRRLYNTFAPSIAGQLDRGHYLWEHRLGRPSVSTFAVFRDGQPEGYLALAQSTEWHGILQVQDYCALTRDAGLRLLQLLADHRMVLSTVKWAATPNDPLMALVPEQVLARVAKMEDWVLRIVDLAAALEQRGYAPHINAELHLDVRDRLLPGNTGRWLVRVVDGAATVERGGDGRIVLDIRDLAAMYSGHQSPLDRCYAGWLSGPDADLAALGFVFAGPPPRMSDRF